tara:strand:- start:11717 stop:13603 length:1887 start_codon:yes stop_codon:yes gene_type:complete
MAYSNSNIKDSKVNRNIKYINRDFNDLRSSLINYSKTYFPNTYSDFSEDSPGMLFMEMASYVGDVLSFYQDNQIQENFLQYARQTDNLYSLAYMMGYTPKVTSVSNVEVDVYQQVPADSNGAPDYNYTLNIASNTTVSSTSGTSFVIQDPIDFSFSSSFDPTELSVFQVVGNAPQYFLLKKTRNAISSTVKSTTFTVGDFTKYPTFNITDSNIVKILDITDSDGNIYYEVPYLAQEMILDKVKNINNSIFGDPTLSSDYDTTPYLLKLKKVSRRFVSRFLSPTKLQIQFGSGDSSSTDETIVPNPNNVGIGLPNTQDKLKTAFSPTNFLFTNTYGVTPVNTTLTVRYLTGGGVRSNIFANTLSAITTTSNIKFNKVGNPAPLSSYIFESVSVNNPFAAKGGSDGDNTEEIRNNSLSSFSGQLRAVTNDDYLVRALSMPPEFGSIAKLGVETQKLENLFPGESPSTLDLYVLGYNNTKTLTSTSRATKVNLSTYLSQYRNINDSLRILDGYVINIGVEIDIIALPNYNSNQVLSSCIQELLEYFNIDNWQFKQPIYLRDIYVMLDKIEGVQTVNDVIITNKTIDDGEYSLYAYDISAATQNNVIFPSVDASIFEVKYPSSDIKGRIINF